MRVPSPFKFYRSHAFLDPYTDEECERLVWRAKVRRADAVWILPLLVAIGVTAAWMAVGVTLAAAVITVAKSGLSNVIGGMSTNAGTGAAWNTAMVLALVVFVLGFVIMRRVLIIRSIRNMLNRAGCPYCDYSLVGLKVQRGNVKCPECGGRVFLHAHRLTAEDLLPEPPRLPQPRK